MKRRDFFRIMGVASGAAMTACSVSDADKKMLPYLVPPEEGVFPGTPHYVRATCMECPAHCGLSVKIRDDKPVKLEGNPDHPINRGALCIRGQASLGRLYGADRLKEPLMRNSAGKLTPVSWEECFKRLSDALSLNRERGNIFLGARSTGSLSSLIDSFCSQKGMNRFKEVEILDLEPIRRANGWLFELPLVPHYHIGAADFLLTIGADILETFVSPVEYAREVQKARREKHLSWHHVEPYTSLTGAAADRRWIVKPGGEPFLLIYLLRRVTAKKPLPEAFIERMPNYSMEQITARTGLTASDLEDISQKMAHSQNPLVISGGPALAMTGGLTVAIYTAALQWALGMINNTAIFSEAENYETVGGAADWMAPETLQRFARAGVVMISRLYAAGPLAGLREALANAAFKAALSDRPTPFTEICDVVLPLSNPLESWGDAEPRKGLKSLIQPALKPLFNTRTEGDILLALMGDTRSYRDYLAEQWAGVGADWIEKGFRRETPAEVIPTIKEDLTPPIPELPQNKEILFITPSIRTFDGRSGDLRLLHEIPDPLTSLSYGYGLLMSPDEAATRKLNQGDMVRLTGGWGRIDAPVLLIPGLPPKTALLPLDALRSINPPFSKTGGNILLGWRDVRMEPLGKRVKPAILAGAREAGKREILPPSTDEPDHHHEHNHDSKENHGGHGHKKFTLYPPHEHKDYRWAMVIDLDRCNGCSACVAACYVENNIPLTGEEEHLRGREMAWLRMEAYYDNPHQPRFIPMMCQHCDAAPCETVCPVYATYHNPEGLNAQIYNRCVGTRYCANNCPYKARRFNWFDHGDNLPLYSVSNPDLSVRPKGVMEKCTFCLQRIRFARDQAKDQGRKIKDGEVITACAQTCPAGAIVFGNMLDPRSEVSRMIQSSGVYRVLESLGTEPAVYYISRRKSGRQG